MTNEKRSPEYSKRSDTKGSKKLLSKTSKPASGTISSPPKAAVLAPNAKKDEVHRRRNPLNDILRRRSGEDATVRGERPRSGHDDVTANSLRPSDEVVGVDARMGERVAELERSLAVAREEQRLMREELDKVRLQTDSHRGMGSEHFRQANSPRQDSTGASEATTPEHLSRTSEHEESSNHPDALNPPGQSASQHAGDPNVDDILRQNYDLRYKVAQLQDQLASQDVTYNKNLSQIRPHGEVQSRKLRYRKQSPQPMTIDAQLSVYCFKSTRERDSAFYGTQDVTSMM